MRIQPRVRIFIRFAVILKNRDHSESPPAYREKMSRLIAENIRPRSRNCLKKGVSHDFNGIECFFNELNTRKAAYYSVIKIASGPFYAKR